VSFAPPNLWGDKKEPYTDNPPHVQTSTHPGRVAAENPGNITIPPQNAAHGVSDPVDGAGGRLDEAVPAARVGSPTGQADTRLPGYPDTRDTGTPGHRDTGTPGHRDTIEACD